MGFSEIAKYVGYVGENKFDEGVVEFLCNLVTAGFKKTLSYQWMCLPGFTLTF